MLATTNPSGAVAGCALVKPDTASVDNRPVSNGNKVLIPLTPPAEPKPGEDLPNGLSELQQLLATPAIAPALQQVVTTVSGQKSTVGRSPASFIANRISETFHGNR